MSNTTWRTVAIACSFLALFVHVVGGLLLTGFIPNLFGLTLDVLSMPNLAQIYHLPILHLPILICILDIWLPLPFGFLWTRRLIARRRYHLAIWASLSTPLTALLLLFINMILPVML